MDGVSELLRFPIDLNDAQSDLLQIFFKCQIRGLVHSCKWLSDIMHSLGPFTDKSPDALIFLQDIYQGIPPNELSVFLFARSLFDAREYDHCAQVLEQNLNLHPADPSKYKSGKYNPLLLFLYLYSRYLACEKRRANDEVELRRVLDQDGTSKSARLSAARCNREILSLKREAEVLIGQIESQDRGAINNTNLDVFLGYVYALICQKLGMKDMAISLLVQAIKHNLCMWPAWIELVNLIDNKEKMKSLNLPSVNEAWMRYFFEAKVFLKLHEGERALEILLRLSKSGFETSQNLQAEIGLAYDELRAMEMAKKKFKELFTSASSRLDNVDIYSNVLFVCEDSAELAYLAHHCVNLDKYRPETCCVVGNFFSLRGQHEKAVIYFQRALKLKPTYSLVWTLVGHEYMELRNTNAAVHAYRQALIHNRHDFRAWYGLGQMYEMLDLPSFALYYYREAQYLMPTDSRLIVALGEIYEKLNRLEEAKKCYWRAYCVGDIEGSALVRLATCFEQCGETSEAAAAHTEFVKLCQRNGVHNQTDLAQAYKYLANFHLHKGHYEDAALAANKCLEFPETREEAKAMFRQITILAGDIEQLTTVDDSNNAEQSNIQINQDLDLKTSQKLMDSDISTKMNTTEIQPLNLSLDHVLVALGESSMQKSSFNLIQQQTPIKYHKITSHNLISTTSRSDRDCLHSLNIEEQLNMTTTATPTTTTSINMSTIDSNTNANALLDTVNYTNNSVPISGELPSSLCSTPINSLTGQLSTHANNIQSDPIQIDELQTTNNDSMRLSDDDDNNDNNNNNNIDDGQNINHS